MFEQKRSDGELTFVATYNKPKNIQFALGDKTLTLDFQFESSLNTYQIIFTEQARLVVQPVGDLTPTTLVQEHLGTLQDLLTFATDQPNEVEEIVYRSETDERGSPPSST